MTSLDIDANMMEIERFLENDVDLFKDIRDDLRAVSSDERRPSLTGSEQHSSDGREREDEESTSQGTPEL